MGSEEEVYGWKERRKSPQLKELTITPSIIVLGSHDIIPTLLLYGGYVWWWVKGFGGGE